MLEVNRKIMDDLEEFDKVAQNETIDELDDFITQNMSSADFEDNSVRNMKMTGVSQPQNDKEEKDLGT